MRYAVTCHFVDPSAPERPALSGERPVAVALHHVLLADGSDELADFFLIDAATADEARDIAVAESGARASHWGHVEILRVGRAKRDSQPLPPPIAAVPAIRVVAMPADASPGGNIFGGWLLAQMDQAAGIAAWARAGGRAVSMALEMEFVAPVQVGDVVSFFAQVVATGRTSLMIAVQGWASKREAPALRLVATSRWSYVAIATDGKPTGLSSP